MSDSESGPREEARRPALEPGQVLAARYRVAAFLGQGAVGEVYEAEDLELGGRIALKILHPEIAGSERVLQRFKREIQLGRRVTHPNVCRVFDLVKPEGGGSAFLTMELLHGETLEERLAREGRLSTAEALPVIGHIAAALAAAHANGVVHRDLKSGNVFLVPNPSGGVRAVVTDFGLAWSSIHEDSSAASLTATGELVGSPAYMAPEQVRGEEATPATDVYALGVVMFEMITGELPFVGKSAFYTALKRLQEPAPSPRVHLSDLDPAWEATILRCLERDPAARFPTVRHVVRSLGATKAEEDATSPLTLVQPRQRPALLGTRWRLGIGFAALLALGALVTLGIHSGTGREPEKPPSSAAQAAASAPAPALVVPRPSVAVLPFDDLSEPGRSDPVLFELLPLELAATGKLRVLPPDRVDQAVRDLGAETPRLRQRLGADFLVSGAFLSNRYDLVVRDARTDRQVASFTEPAGPDLLARLGQRLRSILRAGDLSTGDAEALRAALPEPDAARLYAEGLGHLRRFEAPAARDQLVRAAAADPDRALVRIALGAAWRDLGYPENAKREAKRAFALASSLRPEVRQTVEARYHELADEIPEAIASYQEIAEAVPDDLESGLLQAAVHIQNDQGTEAEATLERLKRLPVPLGTDPRITVARAQAAGVVRDFPREQEIAGQAIAEAEAQGDRRLACEARLSLGEAQLFLSDLDGAERTFEAARQDASRAGHAPLLAQTFKGLGLVRYRQERLDATASAYQEMIAVYRRIGAEGQAAGGLKELASLYMTAGELDQAEAFYRQALAPAYRLGDKRLESAILHNLAKTTWMRGRLTDAKELFRQVLALHREIGFAQGEAGSLQGIGTISHSQGDLVTARRSFQEALAVYRRMGAEKNVPEAINNLAEVSFAMGDLTQSQKEREQAREAARTARVEHEEARAVAGLADVARQRGDLATARRLYDQSLATYQRLDLKVRVADTEDEIGTVLTLQGDLMEALKRYQHALAVAREAGQPSYEAQVLTHQGRALWRWGELERGRTALEQALVLSRKVEEPSTLAEALASLGHIQKDRGDLKTARRSFESALATFRDRGERSSMASALSGLGDVLLAQGEIGEARRRHQEALAARTDMGEGLGAAENRLALARVALAEGKAGPAEAAARGELAVYRKLANAPGEAAATLVLVRALLAQGKMAEARATLQDATSLLDASQEPAVREAAAELRGESQIR